MAVMFADRACERSKDPLYLDTFAAAYAEMGSFNDAVDYQIKAIDAAKTSTTFPKTEIPSLQFRLDLYKHQVPYREVPRGVIFAEYERIVGTRLSSASLGLIKPDEKSKLVDFLLTVPERRYIGASDDFTRQYFDILLLILTSESMDHAERKDWIQRIPDFSEAKLAKFRKILTDEREQLDALDEQFVNRWNKAK
jgi:hypothetical protein